jgi:hypothetical protein
VWDGPFCDPPSQETFDELARLLVRAAAASTGAGNVTGWAAASGVQSVLTDIVSDVLFGAYGHLAQPDPRGYLQFEGERVDVSHWEDTLNPDLGGPVFYFPSDHSGAIYLFLEDEDFSDHDPIGRIEIRLHEIMGAYGVSGSHWVYTGGLLDGILQVKLSVTDG